MKDDNPKVKLGHKVKIISNTYSRALNNSLSMWNITAAQSMILAYLDFCSTFPCQHDIERKFNIKHPTATGILKRLSEKGYVIFVPDEDDRRLKRIAITNSGHAASQNTKDSLDNVENMLISALTEEELKTLNTLLDKLIIQKQDKLSRKDD